MPRDCLTNLEAGRSAAFELVGDPLLLLDQSATSVLSLNRAARSLLLTGDSPDLPLALASCVGKSYAADISGVAAANDADAPGLRLRLGCDVNGMPETWQATIQHITETEQTFLSLRRTSGDTTSPVPTRTFVTDPWSIINTLPIGVEVYDSELREAFANEHSTLMFGFEAGELPTLHDWWQHGYPDPERRKQVEQDWNNAVAESRRTGEAIILQHWTDVTDKVGRILKLQVIYRAVGENHLLVFWDISEEKRLEDQLRRFAETDALTGVYNRRHLREHGTIALQTCLHTGETASLLMLDLDHFKHINDLFGHVYGDIVLKTIADRCRKVLRPTDLLARYGGEEFAILLPHTGMETARAIAERLRNAVSAEPIIAQNQSINVTVSIGIALATSDSNLDSLIEQADHQLYAAKLGGRNRISY